jgi:hypothetical protein
MNPDAADKMLNEKEFSDKIQAAFHRGLGKVVNFLLHDE